jgi:3,4-dihydroxy 2-butanone 4-phosphate synthase/GTP cyclohydrolase II
MKRFMAKFATIEEAIGDLRKGRMIIVVDDEDRENEGDLVIAAEKTTPEIVNFMASHGRGLICLPLTEERAQKLDLPLMSKDKDKYETAFTVSVDAKETQTGISAHDRALTIRKLIDPKTKSQDLYKPGHIFPIISREGGVLERAGHTEATIDLARLSGLYPAGVICEIMKEDGSMARLPDLVKFSKKHDLKIITIADLIKHRMKTEKFVKRTAESKLPTKYGDFRIIGYEDVVHGDKYIALVRGKINGAKNVLVRVHSACLTGDVFGSKRCDCGEQLQEAMRMISEEGRGVLLYIQHHEGRGIGLMNKLKAYELQDNGRDTVEANKALGFLPDLRNYGFGAQVLADLGLITIRLMTNNPRKIVGLDGYKLKVTERVPIKIKPNKHNIKYLRAKKKKLGHML